MEEVPSDRSRPNGGSMEDQAFRIAFLIALAIFAFAVSNSFR